MNFYKLITIKVSGVCLVRTSDSSVTFLRLFIVAYNVFSRTLAQFLCRNFVSDIINERNNCQNFWHKHVHIVERASKRVSSGVHFLVCSSFHELTDRSFQIHHNIILYHQLLSYEYLFSMNFSMDSTMLCVSSNHSTVHMFSIDGQRRKKRCVTKS